MAKSWWMLPSWVPTTQLRWMEKVMFNREVKLCQQIQLKITATAAQCYALELLWFVWSKAASKAQMYISSFYIHEQRVCGESGEGSPHPQTEKYAHRRCGNLQYYNGKELCYGTADLTRHPTLKKSFWPLPPRVCTHSWLPYLPLGIESRFTLAYQN